MTRHKPVGARLCRLPDRPGRGSTRCPRVLLPSFLAFTLRADSTRQHVPPPRHAPPTRARLLPAPASPPRAPRACRRPASLRRLSPSRPKAAFRDGLSSCRWQLPPAASQPPPPLRALCPRSSCRSFKEYARFPVTGSVSSFWVWRFLPCAMGGVSLCEPCSGRAGPQTCGTAPPGLRRPGVTASAPHSAQGHSSNLRPGSRLLPHSPGVTASAPTLCPGSRLPPPPSARGHGAGAARCSDVRPRFPVLCPRPESWSRRRPRAGAGSSGR